MLIKRFIVGPIETNCYLVACEETLEAMVIDPDIREKKDEEMVLSEIGNRGLKLKYIVNTHHHIDHTGGNAMLKKATSAEILIHKLDAPVLPEQWKWISEMARTRKPPPCPSCGKDKMSFTILQKKKKAIMSCNECGFKFEVIPSPVADRRLHHGNIVKAGKIEFLVIHTPGHSPGGISLYSKKEKTVFTGDTLFKGSIGRTDTIDGSFQDIMKSVRGLMKLPENTVVYPGHGEKTTIRKEKRKNPYVQT